LIFSFCWRSQGSSPPAGSMATCRPDSQCRAVYSWSRVALRTLTSVPELIAFRMPAITRTSSCSIRRWSSGSVNSSASTPKFARFCQWMRAKVE